MRQLNTLVLNSQGKGATCNTQICSKPIRTCSRPLVDTGRGINSGHNPKLPPLATPKVGGEKNPTLQNHVQLMQNEEKHMPFEPFCWSTKSTPAINPQSWGWKKSTFQKNVKLMQNEEKHMPFEPFCWSTKTTPAINPQSWGWKKSTFQKYRVFQY